MTFVLSMVAAFSIPLLRRSSVPARAEVPSFEELYDTYFAFAWRTARGLGVPPGNLDDVVQEVFIVVHRKLGEFRPTGSVKSWIFGIVRRVAKDFRRTDRRKGRGLELKEEELAAGDTNPYQTVTRKEALQIVEDFADTLDEERRAIFILAELEEMPAVEIAETLQMNMNTVYSRLKVIKKNLHRFIDSRIGQTSGGGPYE